MPAGRRVGMDVDPKHPELMNQDFLTFPQPKERARWITCSNPPFGRNCKMAVAFFNRAAQFSDVIAFVVPRTFRKQSLQRRLPLNFELLGERLLEEDSFLFEGKPYSVPCCFQIWLRTTARRQHLLTPTTHQDFEFCQPADADFAVRRVGCLAGKVIREFAGYSMGSNYFIRAKIPIQDLIRRLESIDWSAVKWDTAGNPSIGKRELIAKYSQAIDG